MSEELKVLGIIDHVYVGEVPEKGTCMNIVVKTYLYGDHRFIFSLEEMNKMITSYHISDLSLLFDAPVILIGDKSTKTFNFGHLCKTRRIG